MRERNLSRRIFGPIRFLSALIGLSLILGTSSQAAPHFQQPQQEEGTPLKILEEGFESGIPSTWTVDNQDGNAYKWEITNSNVYHGNYAAGVNTQLPSNNDLLITPPIQIQKGQRVSFNASSADRRLAESFNLLISTKSISKEDFVLLAKDDAVSENRRMYTLYSIDLSEYAGQTVYLAIQCVSDQKSFFYLDNFSVKVWPKPDTPVRQIAEFDPMHGVFIGYPPAVPYTMIADMSQHVKVYPILKTPQEKEDAINNFKKNEVNLDNCQFLIANGDSYWPRDWAPWFIFDGQKNMCAIDFEYNRNRLLDNAFTFLFAHNYGFKYFKMPLTQTGGNMMTDGSGITASTTLVVKENELLSPKNINAIMSDYLGTGEDKYHLFEDPNGTYIEHIDCWSKFLDVDKVVIRRVPTTHPQYYAIEAAVEAFKNKISSWEKPYRIFRVDTPNDEPYTNALILNKRLYVAITGNAENDNAAVAVYKKALPGYSIIPVLALEDKGSEWIKTDALHCRTLGIPDKDMLHIEHIPVKSDKDGKNIEIAAHINSYGGHSVTNVYVAWKTQMNGPYHQVPMQKTETGLYQAALPRIKGDRFFYYIHAEDDSGRIDDCPNCGEQDPFIVGLGDPKGP